MISIVYKMLHTPIPNTKITQLEKFTPEQLLNIFESSLKTGSMKVDQGLLYEAWATLFSKLYLTPDELIDSMERGQHRLGEDNERMLCEFIKADCASRGVFVLNVIKKGGMMDRAALIMIADLADIAGIVYENSTGLHILVTACDKRVRPALIKKAGKKLLSSVYDHKDLPALFLFFGMSDLSTSDLDAIEIVFSKNDLRQVMSKRRQGKNALEIFTELSPKVRQNAPRERNEFILNSAVRTTNLGAGSIVQDVSPVSRESFSVPSVTVISGKRVELNNVSIPDTPPKKVPLKPGAPDITQKKMKVMIVDDDEIIRNLLQLRLKLLGYETCAMAESGEEAVILSEKTKPDLVFMDIMMPGKLDGIHAARLIKANSNSRIIFLSGYSDQDILKRAKEVQPDGFIVKPFTDTVLRVTLNFLK
jgi:CheY-like chemotaxis protein